MAIDGQLDMTWRTAEQFGAMDVASIAGRTLPLGRPAIRVDSALGKINSRNNKWVDLAAQVARRQDFVLHRGIYAGLLGPNYETRAEYRMVRRLGADAVGMSTVSEVASAAMLGLNVLAISVISNVARPDALVETSGQEVVDSAALAAPRLLEIAHAMCRELAQSA